LESALWCRYCYGTTESGAVIPANDPSWDRLNKTAIAAKADPQAWLAMSDIYGDVGTSPLMQSEFAAALKSLWANGTKATVQAYLK
jgi:mannitol 2-dehydrogenase